MVRAKGTQYLARLTARYPYVQWSKGCLSVLLDLLHVIENTLDTDSLLSGSLKQPQTTMHAHGKPTLTFGASGVDLLSALDLPESRALRMTLLENLCSLAVSWLREARHAVPQESVLVVAEYVQAVQRHTSSSLSVAHLGVSIALKHVAATDRDTGTTFAGALNAGGAMAGTVSAAPGTAVATTGAGVGTTSHHSGMLGADGFALSLSRSAALPGLIASMGIKERSLGEISGFYDHYCEVIRQRQTERQNERQIEQKELPPRGVDRQPTASPFPLSSPPQSTRAYGNPILPTPSVTAGSQHAFTFPPVAPTPTVPSVVRRASILGWIPAVASARMSEPELALPFGKAMSAKLKRDFKELLIDFRTLQKQHSAPYVLVLVLPLLFPVFPFHCTESLIDVFDCCCVGAVRVKPHSKLQSTNRDSTLVWRRCYIIRPRFCCGRQSIAWRSIRTIYCI